MKYITVDPQSDGTLEEKEWVCFFLNGHKFSPLVRFIFDEECKEYWSSQPERLNPKTPKGEAIV